VLSVLLRFTDSDYPFGFFKLFWNIYPQNMIIFRKIPMIDLVGHCGTYVCWYMHWILWPRLKMLHFNMYITEDMSWIVTLIVLGTLKTLRPTRWDNGCLFCHVVLQWDAPVLRGGIPNHPYMRRQVISLSPRVSHILMMYEIITGIINECTLPSPEISFNNTYKWTNIQWYSRNLYFIS
jgi:hypothetical protein